MYYYQIENSQADAALLHLGLTRNDFNRFRGLDIDFSKKEIKIETQSGGLEHECYCNYIDEEIPRNTAVEGDVKKHEAECIKVLEDKIKRNKYFLRIEDFGERNKMCWYVFRYSK